MRGKELTSHPMRRLRAAIIVAAIAAGAGLALSAVPVRPATGRGPTTTSRPAATAASTTSAATAPATTKATPAIQADVILKSFPGNANVIPLRSDARNFTIEGRIRDVRTVTVDASGAATSTAPAGARTEVRMAIVGRSQSDDVAAHFSCRFDKANEDAAAKLKPDQLVRLTGAIGKVAGNEDRIEMLNCHDLTVTGGLTIGDQIVGAWRSTEIMVDGALLRKANQARGIKTDDIPDANYLAPWHLDLIFKADNTLSAELSDNNGQSLKKLAGRYQEVKDAADELRLKVELPGMAPQEVPATMEGGRLKFTLPGLADRFVLPDTRFGKLEGKLLPVDNAALKNQTMQWFQANIVANAPPNTATFIGSNIDNALASHQGFIFSVGSGALRRGKTTMVIGAYGKLMVLEYSDAQTAINGGLKNNVANGATQNWGSVMVPEVKVDNLVVDNRNAYDPAKPLTGRLTLRALRRPSDAQYLMVAATTGGVGTLAIEKPGPDPQTIAFHFDPLPAVAQPANPRVVLFLIGRAAKPNDLFGDQNARVIAEPMPMLLDLGQPR